MTRKHHKPFKHKIVNKENAIDYAIIAYHRKNGIHPPFPGSDSFISGGIVFLVSHEKLISAYNYLKRRFLQIDPEIISQFEKQRNTLGNTLGEY